MISEKIGFNRVYARVDIDSIRYNVSAMKTCIKPTMQTLAVIKADGYGHGAVMLAKHLDDLVDYYGVAAIDEAEELRRAGIQKPILIIGYTDCSDFERLLAYNISQAVYSVDECIKLSSHAVSMNKKAKVHLKVDTGMSRIGFSVSEEDIKKASMLFSLPGIEVEGIFTHYAKADETDKTFSHTQKERFLQFIHGLKQLGYSIPIKHIDNSAGVMELDDDEFDMVRLGIAMYGLYPSEEVRHTVDLRPAMSLITHVSQIKTLPAGVGISYGGTYTTTKPTKVATLTVGYADGYPRAQSNVGRVLIHGCYAPILGRVCMDQIMVDISDIDNVNIRDEAVLIGNDGDKCIAVEEVAAPAASFNYELICNVARRVPRVYCCEGKDICCVNYLL